MEMCNTNPYTLPLIEFVGGGHQKIPFRVYNFSGKRPFDLSGCECYFSVVNYMSQSGPVVISKEMLVEENEKTGVSNILSVELTSEDTLNLFGKFVYQITIIGSDGTPETPKQGIMNIIQNIDKSILQ